MGKLEDLREFLSMYNNAPTMDEMPRRSLGDKGICGPTSAHVIEEVHVPFNLSYVTVTTGTTAFQNIVGVTHQEIPGRIEASAKALALAGVEKGARLLVTYPPLVNVFTKQALEAYGVSWSFLECSSRDALLLAICEQQPEVVVGESTFLKATLQDAKKMDLLEEMPKGMIFIAAGTPLDEEFSAVAAALVSGTVHDLYGCQEFGWLTLDGIPVREDLFLLDSGDGVHHDLFVGGLPTGDRFPVMAPGHSCNSAGNPAGKIITYSRVRTTAEFETTVLATTAKSIETLQRLAKTILRIKAKILRIPGDVLLDAPETVLSVAPYGAAATPVRIEGAKTALLDSLLAAQAEYQAKAGSKTDPTWMKGR